MVCLGVSTSNLTQVRPLLQLPLGVRIRLKSKASKRDKARHLAAAVAWLVPST